MAEFASIKLSVFVKQDEDQRINNIFSSFAGFDLDAQKLKIISTDASGLDDEKITILELTLLKQKHIKMFLANLLNRLDDSQKQKIMPQLDSRFDDEYFFYLRFDKTALLDKNAIELTDSGNCFHIKMAVLSFPKKRELCIEFLKKTFS